MAISVRMAWLLAMIVIGAIGIALSQQRLLDPVENRAISVTSPANDIIGDAAERFSGLFDGFGSSSDKSTIANLQAENERLSAKLARTRDQLAASQELTDLAKISDQRPDDTFLTAKVIAKDSKDVRDSLAIDRGTRDGVKEGMVVVGEGGALVGTITRALDNYSWITLVTDPNSKINAVVQESDAKGVLTGRMGAQPLLELLPQEAPIKPGDMVITSGLSGTYPRGLLIGRILGVEGQPQDSFKKARVEPTAQFGELGTVLVMTSFTPANVEAQ